jgi:putative ABC transport system substrate-binding protein
MSHIARRSFLAIAWAFLAAPLAEAQKVGKVYRIGFLSPASLASDAAELEELRRALREIGYVEGQNLIIESRWANGDASELPRLARSLVELKVDVICSVATEASLAAKRATTTIPIVFSRASFADETGLVASLARPGANITGIAFIGPEYGKRLELLREVSPRVARVALMYNEVNPASVRGLRETQRWAERLGIALDPHSIHDKEDIEEMFSAIARNRPDALITTQDPRVTLHRKQIIEFVVKKKLLSMFPTPDFVQEGGLMSYGTVMKDMYRQAAVYVDRILKGARPADLPVEQPTNFHLTINRKAAKALGLTIPMGLLLRADEEIE